MKTEIYLHLCDMSVIPYRHHRFRTPSHSLFTFSLLFIHFLSQARRGASGRTPVARVEAIFFGLSRDISRRRVLSGIPRAILGLWVPVVLPLYRVGQLRMPFHTYSFGSRGYVNSLDQPAGNYYQVVYPNVRRCRLPPCFRVMPSFRAPDLPIAELFLVPQRLPTRLLLLKYDSMSHDYLYNIFPQSR